MTNSYRKESPLAGFPGFGGGAGALSYKSAASKTYVDDVFSTYVYTGTGSTRSISNSIDLSTKGGMTWVKNRGTTDNHNIFDTERGATKYLRSNESTGETTDANSLSAFNSDGFSVISETTTNASSNNYSSWTFRKQKGFFDVVSYTGNGTAGRTISHSLGSIPGCIMIKAYSHNGLSWAVGHRSLNSGVNPWNKVLKLQMTDGEADDDEIFNDTAPTSTNFTVGDSNATNNSGVSYVAYVFAGGDVASGTSSDIDITSKTVTNLGGNFDAAGGFPMSKMTDGILETSNAQNMAYVNAGDNTPGNPNLDVYVDLDTPHVVTKYRIGPQGGNGTSGYNLINNFNVYGTNDTSSWNFVAAFAPGQSGWSGGNYREFEWSTEKSYRYWRIQVTQGDSGNNKAISEWKIEGYSAAANTDSYVFGEDSDKNIISCGGYTGNGVDDGPQINCGWEPQYVMVKRTDSSDNWPVWDVMRGMTDIGGTDNQLRADQTAVEHTTGITIAPTPTGFKITTLGSEVNANNGEYVYIAIRRPDGLVGKPAEAGTNVFAMDTGNTQTTIPNYDSGFPVDFALLKKPATDVSWDVTARLTGTKYIKTDDNTAQANFNDYTFDSNTGWAKDNGPGTMQSWMWKRHAGFTVCTWVGDGQNRIIPHDLSKTPEMIWIKNRGSTNYWIVGHKGLNGGTNPWEEYLRLSTNDAEIDGDMFQDTAPTSTQFAIKANDHVNENTQPFIAMLFASVEGISKCGYYDGSSSGQTITTGFQPRFVIIKSTSAAYPWVVLDTTRGWASGNDQWLQLNDSSEQLAYDMGAPTSTGFTVPVGSGQSTYVNENSVKYIYYAHA